MRRGGGGCKRRTSPLRAIPKKHKTGNKYTTSFARHVDDEERLLLALVVSKVQLVAGSVLDLEVENGSGGRSTCVRHETKTENNWVKKCKETS